MKRAFHFCMEYQGTPGDVHIFDGVITTNEDPFKSTFYMGIKTLLAANMNPPRNPDTVSLRSLALLAESPNAELCGGPAGPSAPTPG